jgi:hypothetical protein
MRISRLTVLAFLMTIVVSVGAQTVVPLGPFRSIELRNGGTVLLRHGPIHRVTILSGNLRCTEVVLAAEQRLVVDNHGRGCREHDRVEIEVITPEVSGVSVSHGGTVKSVGAFPRQAAIGVHVEQGGRIDIRSLAADAVDASIHSGGGIFTTPRMTLTAAVASGGAITYWGDARVTRSVRHGGVVQKGTPGDAAKPLSDLSPSLPPIPPVPPVPPIS